MLPERNETECRRTRSPHLECELAECGWEDRQRLEALVKTMPSDEHTDGGCGQHIAARTMPTCYPPGRRTPCGHPGRSSPASGTSCGRVGLSGPERAIRLVQTETNERTEIPLPAATASDLPRCAGRGDCEGAARGEVTVTAQGEPGHLSRLRERSGSKPGRGSLAVCKRSGFNINENQTRPSPGRYRVRPLPEGEVT